MRSEALTEWARVRAWAVALVTLAVVVQPVCGQGLTDEIKQRGVLRVGAAQAEPWFFKDPSTQQWSGFGVSLGKSLADSLGVKLELVEVTWGTAIAAVQANKIDMMPMLDATPERKQAVDFPETPLVFYGQAVLLRDDLPVKAWEDLNNPKITIAVTQGTTPAAAVKRLAPKANILSFPSNAETVAAFQSGRADACSLFHPPLIMLQEKIGRGRIILPTPVEFGTSSVAVRKGTDKASLDWLDAQIKKDYQSNQTQVWFEEFLKSRGIDPKKVPAIRKELWPA